MMDELENKDKFSFITGILVITATLVFFILKTLFL